MKKTIFIADLHLKTQDWDKANLFNLFLNQLQKEEAVSALYILGDLFDLWIGDDRHSWYYKEVTKALNEATNFFPIYLLHGNRDFLIGKHFLHDANCHLLPDENLIDLYGETILLMHGDTLCTKDIKYLKARKILRNPIIRSIFLMFPISFRKKIARKMRKKSKQHTRETSIHIMDVTEDAVTDVMQKHNVNALIHGHTHRPMIHEHQIMGELKKRFVLGAWHDEAEILVCYEDGRKLLKNFTLAQPIGWGND